MGMRGFASGDDGVVEAIEERERTWPFCGRVFDGEEKEEAVRCWDKASCATLSKYISVSKAKE